MDWDTEFFGYNVAFLSCLHLTENIYRKISLFIKENNTRLVEYLCNCHDRKSVEIAEKYGFSFVDIRLTFVKPLVNAEIVTLTPGLEFRKSTEEDIPALESIANGIYTKSRYFFDKTFEESKVIEFYLSWVRRAVRGEFDDECWCLIDDNRPFAFCTLRYVKSDTAQIGLLGMSNAYHGRGLGKTLLKSVFSVLVEKKISRVIVVTQGRNYPAQNLYQSVGFTTKENQLWYHKWV
jgi:dTDP-4-amino-4,6-dideoxy-D-galactose acyltransferase